MKKETLVKAKELEQDIISIETIIQDRLNHKPIRIVSMMTDIPQSFKLQMELVEWLKKKKIQYEKELEEL